VRSVDDLALFLAGRVRTGGRVVAAAAAAACTLASGTPDWAPWDAAVSARIPSAALRTASRAQGAALLRTVALAFPTPAVAALRALPRVHHPLVLGAAAGAAGADPGQAAALALHHLVGGAATAAVRLLGLDPLRVTAVTVGVARAADPVAADAAALATAAVAAGDPALLPTEGSPLTDVLAELHRASEATLFAS
jgi:urease accessory protein